MSSEVEVVFHHLMILIRIGFALALPSVIIDDCSSAKVRIVIASSMHYSRTNKDDLG